MGTLFVGKKLTQQHIYDEMNRVAVANDKVSKSLAQLHFQQVEGAGYIGSTPFVNESINTFDGDGNSGFNGTGNSGFNGSENSGADGYGQALTNEITFHNKRIRKIQNQSSKNKEIKRHSMAVSQLKQSYNMNQTKDAKNLSQLILGPGKGNQGGVKDIMNADGNTGIAGGANTTEAKKGLGSLLGDLVTVGKSVLTPAATASAATEPKKILGMPPAVFYSIIGLIALSVIVLIVKHKNK